jgi:steroid delta-isomerase-like uncharacterized protein
MSTLEITALKIVETFVEELWNQRQFKLAETLFPADFVAEPIAHQPMWQGMGPESMTHHIQEWYEGVPDLQMKAIATLVQGDQVWMQWEITGTHDGILYGIPATGNTIKALGVTLIQIKDNKIRTLRTIFDGLGLMQQLNILPDAVTLIREHFMK